MVRLRSRLCHDDAEERSEGAGEGIRVAQSLAHLDLWMATKDLSQARLSADVEDGQTAQADHEGEAGSEADEEE